MIRPGVVVLSILTAFSTLAQVTPFGTASAPAEDPYPEITKARDTYEEAKEKAVAPLFEAYLKSLQALRRSYLQKGSTSGVVAVDKEIKLATEFEPSVPAKKIMRFVFGTSDRHKIPDKVKLVYSHPNIKMRLPIYFKKDGTFVRSDHPHPQFDRGTWSIKDDTLTTVMAGPDGPEKIVYRFADATSMKGTLDFKGELNGDEVILSSK